MWGERTSPFTWLGPKRFYAPPLALADLPPLDGVLISHDHYDHLDYPTIQYLKTLAVPFYVPLGVGAHLSYWGIDNARIVELDWWQEHLLGPLRLVSTPARHFSGRSLLMRDQSRTLWSGWAVLGPRHRIYYSGDTAMFPELYHQIHPLKLAVDISSSVASTWLTWRHELLLGQLIGWTPSIVVTVCMVRWMDFSTQRDSRLGRYLARHMTRFAEAVRFAGQFTMWFGAWFHAVWAVVAGVLIVILGWTYSLVRRTRPRE